MICEKPYVRDPTVSKMATVLSREARMAVTPFPCGRCIPCKINRSRVWQARILLENMTCRKSSFVGLTYDGGKKEDVKNLDPSDLTKFIKRLRKVISPLPLRYLAVGEYGDKKGRPHYHLCLFNIGWSRKERELIKEVWGLGIVSAGWISNGSARYMVNYIIKGMNWEGERRLDGRYPEFMRVSKGSKKEPGGLGYNAIVQIAKKIKKKDTGIINSVYIGKRKYPIGRYLTRKLNELRGFDEDKLQESFEIYQEELLNCNLVDGEIFIDNIKNEMESKVKTSVDRYKFFKRPRRYG